jgi:hypothetical protein
MKYVQPVGDRPVGQRPGDSMCSEASATPPAFVDLAVSVCVYTFLPDPAIIESANGDTRPKALLKWYAGPHDLLYLKVASENCQNF